MGTPLGSERFISAYLEGKGRTHRLLMGFIKDVAAASFPREAEQMLKRVRSGPQLVPRHLKCAKNTSFGGLDEGHGRNAPLCVVTLPLYLGSSGACLGTGGEGTSNGPFKPSGFFRRTWTVVFGALGG